MIERLLLLFDCAAEEAVDRIAAAAGYRDVPRPEFRPVLDEFCAQDGRWRLIAAGAQTHYSTPTLLASLREMPQPLQPFVIAIVESPDQVDQAKATPGIDDALTIGVAPPQMAHALKHVRRFLDLQTLYRHHAFNDPLTGMLNRRAVLDILTRELQRAARLQYPVALAMIDIDNYKSANDSLGHIGGDAAMVSLTARIMSQLRPYDALGRYGGDEFLLVLSNCDIPQAHVICERIRASVAATPMSAGRGTIPLTISMGIACALPSTAVSDRDLIDRADLAVYEAKKAGRNRIVVAPVPEAKK